MPRTASWSSERSSADSRLAADWQKPSCACSSRRTCSRLNLDGRRKSTSRTRCLRCVGVGVVIPDSSADSDRQVKRRDGALPADAARRAGRRRAPSMSIARARRPTPVSASSCASASSAVDTSSMVCWRKPSMPARLATASSTTGSVPVLVGADRDQVLLVAVGGHQLAQLRAGAAHLGRDDLADQARYRLEHVDRRVVAGVRQVARQHDVAVEDRADGVGDRLVHVVAVDEHGVEAGDRARRGEVPERSSSLGSSANTLGV